MGLPCRGSANKPKAAVVSTCSDWNAEPNNSATLPPLAGLSQRKSFILFSYVIEEFFQSDQTAANQPTDRPAGPERSSRAAAQQRWEDVRATRPVLPSPSASSSANLHFLLSSGAPLPTRHPHHSPLPPLSPPAVITRHLKDLA